MSSKPGANMRYCPQCAAPLQTEVLEGVERRVCAECGFVFWNNPVPVVAAVVQWKDSVVLARNAAWARGFFSFISGYVEEGEEPEQGVVRECREELGLQARVRGLIGNYLFKPKNQVVMAYWLQTSGTINLGEEIAEYKLVRIDDLARYDFGKLILTGRIIGDWAQRFGALAKQT